MKRALVLLLAVAALVAGCGSSSGSGSGGSSSGGGSTVSTTTAASVLNAASAATKDATSAAFDAKLGIKLGGHVAGAGAAGAALLQGPLTLELKGHAGKATGGKAKFDVDFALNYTGGSFSGEALSPDGKTVYVKMPLLMGPGWHSLPLSGLNSSSTGSSSSSPSTSSGLDALKAEGADPSKWLKNLSLSTSGGQDTISADVDFAQLFADISKISQSGITAKDKAQMAQVEQAVKTAHGSLSFDSSTHLPTDENIHFAMDVPPSLQNQASGLKSVDLTLDISFSDWNQDFTVKAPAGATPFNSAGLLGGLGA